METLRYDHHLTIKEQIDGLKKTLASVNEDICNIIQRRVADFQSEKELKEIRQRIRDDITSLENITLS